ncbi:MAG TPA: RNA methyltransferase [bacterium]|nr:RNA methyltransferase [bacterium]
MTLRITSADNPRVKDALKLRTRRARKQTGRFLVEGTRELARAMDAGLCPELLLVEPDRAGAAGVRAVDRTQKGGGRVAEVTAAVYAKLVLREDAEGLIAVIPIPAAELGDLHLPEAPLVLAAMGVEKPGNLGALLRSADAFGAAAVVTEGGTDLWNPNVVRASLGCLFTVPVAAAPAGGLVPWLRERGLRIAAAAIDGAVAPHRADLTGGVAILVGSEQRGLDADVQATADVRVRIPMYGAVDSLNVSVAAGVLLYEAGRQRHPDSPRGD